MPDSVGPEWAFRRTRERKDVGWQAAFVISWTMVAVGGIAAYVRRSPMFAQATGDADFLNNPAHCPAEQHGRRLMSEEQEFSVDEFTQSAGKFLAASAALSLIVGALFIYLFRVAAKSMVYGACALQVSAFIAVALVSHDTGGRVAFGCLAAFSAFVLYLWRRELRLVGSLLKVASDGLAANPGLVPTALAVTSALAVAFGPVFTVSWLAITNGSLVPNVAAVGHSVLLGQCYDAEGKHTPCCAWQVDTWVVPFIAFAVTVLVWTAAVFSQLRTYIIAGSVCQWYFKIPSRGSTLRSLGHAIGPSFGSVCLSSVVLTACYAMRACCNALRRSRVFFFLWFVCSYVEQFISAISQFATVQMAATGEGFFEATNSVTVLLSRNLLSSVGVWWLPTFVMTTTSIAIAALWGQLTAAASYTTWKDTARPQAQQDCVMLGVLAAAICFVVLTFVSQMLKDAVDTVYIAYARDLDNQTVTRTDVHDCLKELPTAPGAVVVQPDDGIAYGAVEEGQAGGEQSGTSDELAPLSRQIQSQEAPLLRDAPKA